MQEDEKELNDIKSLKYLGITCCKERSKQADLFFLLLRKNYLERKKFLTIACIGTRIGTFYHL